LYIRVSSFGNMAANTRNVYLRERILDAMRALEADGEVNRTIIPPAPQSATVGTAIQMPRIEVDHLVSTVRFSKNFVYDINDPRRLDHVDLRIESLSENIDLRELHYERLGENVERLSAFSGDNESQNYLTTFPFPENTIVFRHIQDDCPPIQQRPILFGQIIWSSRFTWRQIKQHLEDNTYNFDFIDEVIIIGRPNITDSLRAAVDGLPLADSLRAAVDGLPLATISEDSESSDGAICAICHEPFSNEEPAKQLPCIHFYHSRCILTWFRRKISCPICRDEPGLRKLIGLN